MELWQYATTPSYLCQSNNSQIFRKKYNSFTGRRQREAFQSLKRCKISSNFVPYPHLHWRNFLFRSSPATQTTTWGPKLQWGCWDGNPGSPSLAGVLLPALDLPREPPGGGAGRGGGPTAVRRSLWLSSWRGEPTVPEERGTGRRELVQDCHLWWLIVWFTIRNLATTHLWLNQDKWQDLCLCCRNPLKEILSYGVAILLILLVLLLVLVQRELLVPR